MHVLVTLNIVGERSHSVFFVGDGKNDLLVMEKDHFVEVVIIK